MSPHAELMPGAVLDLVDATLRVFRSKPRRRDAFHSFCTGCWKVFVQHHSELARFRSDYFALAEAALERAVREVA